MLGRDPWTDAVALHREIAYVPGDVTLWPSLTGGETIDLLARMRGGIDEARRAELIERFDLDPKKKARTYSKGNRQKVSLISAFSSRARLLLLDEPSSGLDPLMEQIFRECVMEARDRGVTVLLSSHILAETEALCKRVTIIRAGKTVESGTLESMRHLSRTSIKAEIARRSRRSQPHQGCRGHQLRRQHPARSGRRDSLGELIRVLGDTGVRSLVSQPPTLEELFLRHYKVDGSQTAGATPRCRHDHRRRRTTARRPNRCARPPAFTGTFGLLRLYLRRDRIVLPLWVLLLSCPLASVYIGSIETVFPTAAQRAAFAASIMASPAQRALVRQRLQRQCRRGRDLEGRGVPCADRCRRHPDRHPPHPRRRGIRPHRTAGLDRCRTLCQPYRRADPHLRCLHRHRADRHRRPAHHRRAAGRVRWLSAWRSPALASSSPPSPRCRRSSAPAPAPRVESHSACSGSPSRCGRWATQARAPCRGSRRWAGHCKSARTRVSGGGCCCSTWRPRSC